MRSSSNPTPWPGLYPLGPVKPCFKPSGVCDQISRGDLASGGKRAGCRPVPAAALGPNRFFRQTSHLGGSHAGRIHRANDAAHAGAGNAIDRNVIFLHPLNHANLGQSKRAAAAESETDSRTMSCSVRRFRRVLRPERTGKRRERKKTIKQQTMDRALTLINISAPESMKRSFVRSRISK